MDKFKTKGILLLVAKVESILHSANKKSNSQSLNYFAFSNGYLVIYVMQDLQFGSQDSIFEWLNRY